MQKQIEKVSSKSRIFNEILQKKFETRVAHYENLVDLKKCCKILNDYLLAKIGADPAENEPSKVWFDLPACPLPPTQSITYEKCSRGEISYFELFSFTYLLLVVSTFSGSWRLSCEGLFPAVWITLMLPSQKILLNICLRITLMLPSQKI